MNDRSIVSGLLESLPWGQPGKRQLNPMQHKFVVIKPSILNMKRLKTRHLKGPRFMNTLPALTAGRYFLLFTLVFFAWPTISHAQQTQHGTHKIDAAGKDRSREAKQIDLVVFGDSLGDRHLQFFLKSNPGFGEKWERAYAAGQPEVSADGRFVAIRGLSRERFFGQDIRKNHLALQLRYGDTGLDDAGDDPKYDSAGGSESCSENEQVWIRAVYVVGSAKAPEWPWEKWLERIGRDPSGVKERSLGSYVRPRPLHLEPGQRRTLHVRAPVRHLKPGVQEVKWLDILFR